jgi:uncharacterized protein
MEYPKVDEKFLKEVVKRILSVGNPEKIILFGSQARKTATATSDIDILIVEHSELPRHKRARKYRKSLAGMYPSKDIVVWTPNEIDKWAQVPNAFITQAVNEGIVQYEKSA